MICILSDTPMTDWAKSKVIGYALKAGLNKNHLVFKTYKTFKYQNDYKVVMPCDNDCLTLVTNQYNIVSANCYLIQETSKLPCPVIPFYHPNDAMIDPVRFLFLSKAFTKAYRYLNKDFDPEMTLLISNNINEIDNYLVKCENAKEVCIDLETTFDVSKISPLTGGWKDVITAVGISKDPNEAMCFSRENLTPLQFNCLIDRVVKINANPNIDKIGQNYVMFDAQVLYWWKVSQLSRGKDNLVQNNPQFYPRGNLWDTMHLFNILYPNDKSNVKGISKGLLEQIRLYTLSDIHKDGSYTKRGIELRKYCALDVVQTYRILKYQLAEMKEREMEGYYEKYRLGLGEAIVAKQIEGVKIDRELLKKLIVTAEAEVRQLVSKMHKTFGDYVPMKEQAGGRDYEADRKINIDPDWNFPTDLENLSRKDLDKLLVDKKIAPNKSQASQYFIVKKQHLKKNPNYQVGCLYKKMRETKLMKQVLNPNSPLQLKAIFKALKVKLPRGSTNNAAIQKVILNKNTLVGARDLARAIEKYRKISKFLNTYCKVKLDLDGRLRGSFNVEANDTGRSACRKTMWGTGFNMQTLPSHYLEVNLDE